VFSRRVFLQNQLPGFDASKKENRIQKTGNRSWAKPRRQKPVVGFTAASAQMQASKTGSVGFWTAAA
jgi:hypothetical protein